MSKEAMELIARHLENAKQEYKKAAAVAEQFGLKFHYQAAIPAGGNDGGSYWSQKFINENPKEVEYYWGYSDTEELEAGWHSSSETC